MTKLKSIALGCLAAGVLIAGLLLPVHVQADGGLLQEERKPRSITVSGTAILPDGRPGADLPVEIKEPLDVFRDPGTPPDGRPPPKTPAPDFRYKTLAKGTTDAAGRFSLKFEPKGAKFFQLDIGKKTESAWTIKPLKNKGKDIDLGELQLRERVPEK